MYTCSTVPQKATNKQDQKENKRENQTFNPRLYDLAADNWGNLNSTVQRQAPTKVEQNQHMLSINLFLKIQAWRSKMKEEVDHLSDMAPTRQRIPLEDSGTSH